jgi:hypothetical protein
LSHERKAKADVYVQVYSNSLLATLNARKMIQAAGDNVKNTSILLNDLNEVHTVRSFGVGGESTTRQVGYF